MTATNGAPDPVAAAEERWQRLQDQLETVGIGMRTETGSAITSIDACLRRLDTVRRHLADHPRAARTNFASVAGPAPASPLTPDPRQRPNGTEADADAIPPTALPRPSETCPPDP